MKSPALGHYVIGYGEDQIRVIPPGGGEDFIRFWCGNACFPLSSDDARKIARGLIICAERLDYPDAIAGPDE